MPPESVVLRAARRRSGQSSRRGIINGVYSNDILVDTGATQTLVRKELVTDDHILDAEVMIHCAHGDTASYPLAAVKITIGGKDIITTAGVSSTIPASALLSWDVPELLVFVADRNVGNSADTLAAMTCLRHCQQQEALDRDPPSQEGGASAIETKTLPETPRDEPELFLSTNDELPPAPEDTDLDLVFNFDDSIFIPADPPMITLTPAQKRANRGRFRHSKDTSGILEPDNTELSPEELHRLQSDDESLSRPRSIADGVSSAVAGEDFYQRDRLLYRHYSPPVTDPDDRKDDVEQLVLPSPLRPMVLKLAHDIPMAGHLGKKTAGRILHRFYWSGLHQDVAQHCKTCEQCQKSSTRKGKKAPLVPLPIIDEPFRRIAMNIVGPLPRSSSGKRYILVICDYATRYPDPVALCTIDANAVAEELLSFFACVGVPEEILTDQGTNFTSQLLKEVYRLLHIRPIRTTPYHPQTDGGTIQRDAKGHAQEDGNRGRQGLGSAPTLLALRIIMRYLRPRPASPHLIYYTVGTSEALSIS